MEGYVRCKRGGVEGYVRCKGGGVKDLVKVNWPNFQLSHSDIRQIRQLGAFTSCQDTECVHLIGQSLDDSPRH